jgi:hypothetical protein
MTGTQSDYVNIVRYFRDVDEAWLRSVPRRFSSLGDDNRVTWSHLLDPSARRPIVLIASSGAGKTEELRAQAVRLRNAKRHAVYAEATALLDGVESALAHEESVHLDRWLAAASEPLHFFIDAVDELHQRHRRFSDLARKLSQDQRVDFGSVSIVVSACTGAWTQQSTVQLAELARSTQGTTASGPRLVTLEPIDLVALRRLAEANGVQDIEAFIDAVESEEVTRLIDLRPADVRLLCRLWRRQRHFGAWSTLLSDIVDESLVEDHSDQLSRRQMTAQEGRRGLERLAAAVALTNKAQIAHPTLPVDDGLISSRQLFVDWSPGKQNELFETALFVHRGANAETLQLPQGDVSPYLAARWLGNRVRSGWPVSSARPENATRETVSWTDRAPDSIASLVAALLVRVFDEEHFRIPDAYVELAGWVASEVPEFRRLLIAHKPEVVLYGGDPRMLSAGDVRGALSAVCASMATNGLDTLIPTQATVRQLARKELEQDVGELLSKHTASTVRRQLLRFVATGGYSTCADVAFDLALNENGDDSLRAAAVKAVCLVGTTQQRTALLNLVPTSTGALQSALLEGLVPHTLSGATLVALLGRGGDLSVRFALSSVAREIATDDLEQALTIVCEPLVSGVLDSESEARFNVAVPLLIERLRRGDASPAVLECFGALEELLAANFHLASGERVELERILDSDRSSRESLWRRRVESVNTNPNLYACVTDPKFAPASANDLSLLWQLSDGRGFVRATVDETWRHLSAEDKDVVLSSCAVELRHHLRDLDEQGQRELAETARRERETREAVEASRAQRRAQIAERLDQIVSADDVDALLWAWQKATSHPSGVVDLARLTQLVGADYADAFRRGMIALWHKEELPPADPERSGTPTRYLLGLAGVELEVASGRDVRSFSSSEARTAARYALYKHNSLPSWLDDVFDAQPVAVSEVLTETFTAEWRSTGSPYCVLGISVADVPMVARAIGQILIALASNAPPMSVRVLHSAIDLWITSYQADPRLVEFAKQGVESIAGSDDKRTAEYLRLWAHFEPECVAANLKKQPVESGGEKHRLLLRVAELLCLDVAPVVGRGRVTAFTSAPGLAAWTKLLLPTIRHDQDSRYQGAGNFDSRAYAEELRNACLSMLADKPTFEAHVCIQNLLHDPELVTWQAALKRLDERQRRTAANANVAVWTESDVLGCEHGDEKKPASLHELFELVRRHLQYVGRLVENDQFSYRGLFSDDTLEREIQLWVASCLRERARGLYGVEREPVVDHNKEVDISALAPGVGTVPIEIKPVRVNGGYSLQELIGTITNQLLERYMRTEDRKYGILLVVCQSGSKSWTIDGEPATFEVLVDRLRVAALEIGQRAGKVICVETINVASGLPPARRKKKAAAKAKGEEQGCQEDSDKNGYEAEGSCEESSEREGCGKKS